MYWSVLCFEQRALLKPQRSESLSQIDNSTHHALLLSDGHVYESKLKVWLDKNFQASLVLAIRW